jgi:hypothetical protein
VKPTRQRSLRVRRQREERVRSGERAVAQRSRYAVARDREEAGAPACRAELSRNVGARGQVRGAQRRDVDQRQGIVVRHGSLTMHIGRATCRLSSLARTVATGAVLQCGKWCVHRIRPRKRLCGGHKGSAGGARGDSPLRGPASRAFRVPSRSARSAQTIRADVAGRHVGAHQDTGGRGWRSDEPRRADPCTAQRTKRRCTEWPSTAFENCPTWAAWGSHEREVRRPPAVADAGRRRAYSR